MNIDDICVKWSRTPIWYPMTSSLLYSQKLDGLYTVSDRYENILPFRFRPFFSWNRWSWKVVPRTMIQVFSFPLSLYAFYGRCLSYRKIKETATMTSCPRLSSSSSVGEHHFGIFGKRLKWKNDVWVHYPGDRLIFSLWRFANGVEEDVVFSFWRNG